ncbi:MAG: class I SAM-dependent methyltransferase [Actinomycetota bacterium]
MTALGDLLLEEIRRSGPITFADYMARALYDPQHGYYSSGAERTGWRGDFVTSAEVDPAFGELWARFFEQAWEACGRPPRFDLVEVGAGEGGSARAVLSTVAGAFREALFYRLVEPIAALRARQRALLRGFERVGWSHALADVPVAAFGCVFANEVLDNLPVHLVTLRDGCLQELLVATRGERLVLVEDAPRDPGPLEAHLARTAVKLEEDARIEVCLQVHPLVRAAAACLRRGAVVLVDYGMTAGELAQRGGTLARYSGPRADDLVLEDPGAADVTAHVNWTWVRLALKDAGLRPWGPETQRATLRRLGLGELDGRLRAVHRDALRAGDGAAAVRALSRRHGLAALADPGGLGGLGVMTGCASIELPGSPRAHRDRRAAGPCCG